MEEKNLMGNINTVSNQDSFGIKSDNNPYALSFYFDGIFDDKALKKFIKNTERLIRGSREYNSYIENLRTNVGILNHDNLLHNIETSDAPLEFHHYPLTLYEIIEIVIYHNIAIGKKFTTFSIAKEVMDCHFKNIIGLVSLMTTTHELTHAGAIFIGEDQIFGDYKKFIELYDKGISFDIKTKIETMQELSKNNAPSDFKGLLQ